MYNILVGGAAGQGIETTVAILEKAFKRAGYSVFTQRDFMSRVRGGHNFSLIRFGTESVCGHSYHLDGLVALDAQTLSEHLSWLSQNGFILCDSSLQAKDLRSISIDMNAVSKELGNPRVAGSIAIGAILKLFGERLNDAEDILSIFLKPQYLEVNLKALREGYSMVEEHFPHLEGPHGRELLISGSRAMALGAIAAGLRFYAAYPMSPATPLMETLASVADDAGLVVEQAEDEIAAINMAIGASYAGARAMTGTSGGGFSLMVEALGLAGMAEIPLVIVDVQRPGPATGLPTRTEQSDLTFAISASQGEFPRIVISVRNAEDAFYQTMRSFDLAERYQVPVIILSDQYVGDSSWTVSSFDPTRISVAAVGDKVAQDEEYLRYRNTQDGVSPRLIPGISDQVVAIDSDEHDEAGHITESADIRKQMVDKRMRKLKGIKQDIQEPSFIGGEEFKVLLIGWGSMWAPLTGAVRLLNEEKHSRRYAALVFGDIYPLPQKVLLEKSQVAECIIDVEQNATGQLADLIRRESGICCDKRILKYDGRQICGEEIAKRIREVEGR
jgi:2-oxoglutarate ferredoxin oxidoreductase subunit alpha